MRAVMNGVRAALALGLVTAAQTIACARGPGSTVQGDILRGEGQFLRGRGIYELYSARGRQIDAQTEMMIQQWNAEVYAAYLRERASRILSKKRLTEAAEQEARRKMAEREERLRTSPTDEDVVTGDALNALLTDLSDPTIDSAAWRLGAVPLPEGVSIRALFFRFAPRLGDQASKGLTGNLIALGRLDPARGWPIFIPEDKVGAERRAYEAAHRRLLEQCERGKLSLDAVRQLDASLLALKAKVKTAVPTERSFRSAAERYVDDMKKATAIFNASTIDFAQEMIRDTHDYTPQTVGELLAFVRKYRLLFASAEGRPNDGDMYRLLYGLLRRQKEALGLKIAPAPDHAAEPGPRGIALFNGKDLTGWTAFEAGRRLDDLSVMARVENGRIILLSDMPGGGLRTDRSFRDFVLTVEYMFPLGGRVAPMGSGLLLMPDSDDGLHQYGIECDLNPAGSGEFWSLRGTPLIADDLRGRMVPRKGAPDRPTGQWNELVIRCAGPRITVELNGQPINEARTDRPLSVYIGLMNQQSEVRFRSLRLVDGPGKLPARDGGPGGN